MDSLFVHAGLVAELPEPATERFQPLRAGIINIWQYDRQEFRFHEGRLILRGENGTGKSKALELLLPFLLDADLSPKRLDPFAGTARTMRWNLLEGERHDSRVGYVWLEFGRRGDGGSEFVTLGAGLRAAKSGSGVDSWYFVTPHRVGHELELVSPTGHPIGKAELRDVVGTVLFERAADYRARVDSVLYGLGADRFAALRHLLLQLRRPHLSENLDTDGLSQLLSESLPPIDVDLISQLSEGFERLDRDKDELLRIERSVDAVERFLRVYTDYCRGVARAAAAEVRGADSRYHRTAARVRDAEGELVAAVTRLAARQREIDAIRTAIAASQGTIRALTESDAWRSARDLQIKREHTDTLRNVADQDAADLRAAAATAAERDRIGAETAAEVERRRAAVVQPRTQAATLAAATGLASVYELAVDRIEAADTKRRGAAVSGVSAAIEDRRQAVGELRRLAAERDRCEHSYRAAEEHRREVDATVCAAGERAVAARRALDAAHERLDTAVLAWAGALGELRLDAEALDRLRAAAAGEDGAGNPVAVLGEVAVDQRTALIAARADHRAERTAVATARQAVQAERDAVAATAELGPAPPRTRAADRSTRPGAPLYLLCDFRDGLTAPERAGLEAALEAAGLLDAWVTPDGRVLDPGTHDEVVVPRPLDAEPTLADALVPVDGRVVPTATIEAVLRSLALGPAGASDVPHRIGTDGSWRLGPLHGAWAKAQPEHIGAGAREAARERRLAELGARLTDLDAALEVLNGSIGDIDARIARLDAEVRALPPTDDVESARHHLAASEADEDRRRGELARTEAATATARAARDRAADQLAQRARSVGMEAHLPDLDAYGEHLQDFRAGFGELVAAIEALWRAAATAEYAATEAAQARDEAASRRTRTQRSADAAASAGAELDTLEASVGVEAAQIVARHGAEVARLHGLESEIEQGAEAIAQQREARVRAEERVAHATIARDDADAERTTAAAALRRVAETGVLALVVSEVDGSAVSAEAVGAWPFTRLLDLARAVEAATLSVDCSAEALDQRANRMHERYMDLTTELGADFQVHFERHANVQVVRMLHNNRTHDVPAIHRLLVEEAATRRGLLEERERELLRQFLLGEVGGHLRARLREARVLVDAMNTQMDSCATASGLRLKLQWRPERDIADNIREVIGLLRQDLDLLADADQHTLAVFLQERITAARQEVSAVPWTDHLLQALDYRSWHQFTILVFTPESDDWIELTKQGHGAKSGGEKSVALHLPLFAAAAAHYRSAVPTAPRLIMLDEAFAGIDQGMRGRCMGLLVDFDLDFMMTSHDEWGCYEELDGVATYQLYRQPGIGGGVAAIPFVWNGRRLVEYDPESGRALS